MGVGKRGYAEAAERAEDAEKAEESGGMRRSRIGRGGGTRMEIEEDFGVGGREDVGGGWFLLCPSGQSRAPKTLGVWVVVLLRSIMAPYREPAWFS